jgi:hypothetical protein
MEARMESARRASDLHQKRTGKKLRITETIVQNEEMYEEEDPNYEERARRREQWLSPSFNYSAMPQSPGNFSYPQPLQIFPFQPASAANTPPALNTNVSNSGTNAIPQSPLTPASPMAMQLQQYHFQLQLHQQNSYSQSNPSSPMFENTAQEQNSSRTVSQQCEKPDKYLEPMGRTSQDLSLGFSNMLFGDSTMRPSGVQTPQDFSDFSLADHLTNKNSSDYESHQMVSYDHSVWEF